MPCVAGSRCKLSHLTPDLLGSTGHKGRKCEGQLHGICGVPDPLSNIDTKRICDVECEPAAATKHTESKRSRAADTGKKDAAIDLTSTHGGSGRAGGNAGLIGASKTKAKAHGAEKRKHPTLGEKAEILDLQIKKKMRKTAVAEKTGFALRTIQRAVADREKLEAKLKEQPSAANNKTFRGPKYPEVDTIVMEMIDQYRSAGLPINRATIQTWRKACATVVDRAKSDEQRKHHFDFSTSEHWAKNFITRRGLRSVGLHEEAGSVDDADFAKGMAEIREACKKYEPKNIYNEGETGLCYRLLPKRTYLAPGENRKTTRGVKGMAAKERLSVYVCTNATGTRKMPLTIIGTAKNPRCFRNRSPPVKYLSQKRAWSDKHTMGEWWYEFLGFVRKFTTKPVLLLMDNPAATPTW